jgi:acyl-CoA thioesterase-1
MRQKLILRATSIFLLSTQLACSGGSQGDLDYVALGASDTAGVGATPITNGYAYLIEEGLEQAGKQTDLDNFGIPGAEIGDIDNLEVQLLKISKPGLITLSTGANDLVDGDPIDGFESDLHGLLVKLRNISPDATIAISNLPDITKAKRFVDEPDANVTTARVQGYNNATARQAQAFDALLVDLYSEPLDDSLFSDQDGYHPSDRGHRAIADKFLEVILPIVETL